MNIIYWIIAFFSILIIGFFRLLLDLKTSNKNLTDAIDFLKNFRKVVEAFDARRFESEAYATLMTKVDDMQRKMGTLGLIDYRPPFEGYIQRNYPVILNTLSEIRAGKAHRHTILIADDCLIRYCGSIQQDIEQSKFSIKNPLVWLREGVRFIITLPFFVLESIGLLPEGSSSRLRRSLIVRLIASIFTLIGLIASIMQIILSWDDFVHWLEAFF